MYAPQTPSSTSSRQQTPWRSRYGARLNQVRVARHDFTDWLRSRPLPFEIETAVLVLGELANNAVLHAGTEGGDFVCRALHTPHGALCLEVHDQARGHLLPRARTSTCDEESGRGLSIVEALAQDWGVMRSGITGGNAVWATIAPAAPA